MKAFLLLAVLISSTSFAAVNLDNVDCYSDMSDGECKQTETATTYEAECFITVELTYKNGDKVEAILEGKSSINKNKHAVMMNNIVKDRSLEQATRQMYLQINPFFSMKSCE